MPARSAGEGDRRAYYKGARLKQLRAFCAVVRLGSVARAAEALFLSAPSVSLLVSALERELGARLLVRGGRRLLPSDEGQVLYELARPLVEGIEGLELEFRRRLSGRQTTSLDIAAGTSTIQYLLPPLVKRFRELHPAVQLKLHNVTGRDGLALLRSGEVDLAVGSMLEVPNDLDYAPVYFFDPVLIMPRDHPLAGRAEVRIEDLSPYGLILPPARLTTYRLVDAVFRARGVPYTVALEVGGWELIKQYVAMGLGISIVTSICLTGREELATYNLRRYFPQRSYGVVIRKGAWLSAPARAFVELVKPGLFRRRGYDDPGHSER
ncbi:MAG: LysR family transcriptional regulator [Xanthomonadales bacterium]|nr:LysR family transcriptional regulator [Xanthomonadales bacterium]